MGRDTDPAAPGRRTGDDATTATFGAVQPSPFCTTELIVLVRAGSIHPALRSAETQKTATCAPSESQQTVG